MMVVIKNLMQGEYELPTTYGKQAWRLFLQLDKAEDCLVIRNFIAAVDRCEFQLKLQA